MNYYNPNTLQTFTLLITGLVNLLLAYIVLRNNRRNRINFAFSTFSIGIAIWSITSFLFYQFGSTKQLQLIYGNLLFAGAMIIPGAFFYFAQSFPQNTYVKRSVTIFIIIITIFFFVAFPFSIRDFDTDGKPIYGFIFKYLYPIYFLLFIGGGLCYLIFKFKRTSGIYKLQLIYFFSGTTITAFLASITNIILPLLGNFNFAALGPSTSIIMLTFTTYAILKHHLLNVKVIATELFAIAISLISLFNVLTSENIEQAIIRSFVLIGIVIFSYLLIRGVLKEVHQRERIQKLAKDLRHANVELRKLDEAKSEFVSIASHQLRTPLSIVKGFVSMLLEGTYGKIEGKQLDALGKVYDSNERLITLVNNLLNLSRIEKGKLVFDFGAVAIEDILDSVVEEMEGEAKRKNLYLNWAKPEKPMPEIWADKDQLRQAIINLIDNAIKYTPKGGIDVSVDREGETLIVKITDTGIGMEEREIYSLFRKFVRGQGGSKVNTEGTGIGLYVTKRIIEAHKGSIRVYSPGKGKGSTFYITLPVYHRPSPVQKEYKKFVEGI